MATQQSTSARNMLLAERMKNASVDEVTNQAIATLSQKFIFIKNFKDYTDVLRKDAGLYEKKEYNKHVQYAIDELLPRVPENQKENFNKEERFQRSINLWAERIYDAVQREKGKTDETKSNGRAL